MEWERPVGGVVTRGPRLGILTDNRERGRRPSGGRKSQKAHRGEEGEREEGSAPVSRGL